MRSDVFFCLIFFEQSRIFQSNVEILETGTLKVNIFEGMKKDEFQKNSGCVCSFYDDDGE